MREITLGKQLSQLDYSCRGDDQLLGLRRKVESLDVDKCRVFRGDVIQIRCDVNGIEPFFIGRRLLADIPFQRGQCQVLAAFCDRGLQPFGRVAPIRAKGKAVWCKELRKI